jgi:hypothetical protein
MKKVIFIIMLVVCFVTTTKAQNDTVFYVNGLYTSSPVKVCTERYDRAIVRAFENCDQLFWRVNGTLVENTADSIIITPDMVWMPGVYDVCQVRCNGCNHSYTLELEFWSSNVPTENTEVTYVHGGEYADIQAVEDDSTGMYTYHWSNNDTTNYLHVPAGTYVCAISDGCGTSYRTRIVRECVEIYRATVDLETNLNKTTWQVTEEQAEYISEVKVYRDGLLVGTAPYEDGYYMDAIGSDNAARNYQIIGVTTEGVDCPIASYEKGTIHTTYYEDVNHNLNMTWNVPFVEEGAQGTVTYFQICKYDPATGDLTVVDQVNSSVTDYTCGVNQFDGGQAVIAAVFNDGKGLEELSFSNLTTDILGIGENNGNAFRIYPNPAKDRVTVEGTGILTVTNTLGQTILTKEIDGKGTLELPKGLYFVKLNGITRKIVVE